MSFFPRSERGSWLPKVNKCNLDGLSNSSLALSSRSRPPTKKRRKRRTTRHRKRTPNNMAASETGQFEVMEVADSDDDLMLFAEDQSDRDISLDIDLSRNNQNHLQPRVPKTKRGFGSRIEVVVRKRPLNNTEMNRGETDIVQINNDDNKLTISEPRLKVDLTKYTQKHKFTFDHCFDEYSTNAEIYETSVKPLFDTILVPGPNSKYAGKATCFGYGQTGSGKTYTLLGSYNDATGQFNEGLYAMAVRDLFKYKPADNRIIVSFYEIYGGKMYDLLNDRSQVLCREDGKQKVNIVGLKSLQCTDAHSLMDVIARGNLIRATGSTGANNASSRSHAILSMDILPIRGRISFIDLAGSERGADTANNDKQTRIEGAEINKSLLALKECIRALDMNSIHKPFRGSKLTQVLKESFMGNSKTLMVANISPNSGSCENTLNTLRYAYRVKELKSTERKALSRNRSAPNLTDNMPSRPGTARKRKGNGNTASGRNNNLAQRLAAENRRKKNMNRGPEAMVKKRARSPGTPSKLRPLKSSEKRSRTPTQSRSPRNVKYQFEQIHRDNSVPVQSSKLKPHPPSGRKHQEEDSQSNEEDEHKEDAVLNSSLTKKQLIKAHRRHIDEFMLLIKEDMQLLKCFDKDEFGKEEYQEKLANVLEQQEKAVRRYKEKVFHR